MEPIYVTGHRNPDTDSIVSAMAYAALRNALGDREFVPARLGHISDETRLVLGRFGFEPPIRIQTMRTQVRDLDYDTPPALSGAVTVSRAWTALQNNRSIPAIPVTNDNGELYGMLSPSEIASYDMRTLSDSRVDRIPVFNLLSVLDGKIINEDGYLADTISGEVSIALPQDNENLLFRGPDAIVIIGEQPEMARRALEQQVSCLIVCQAELPEELRQQQTNTCIIATPFDAYKAARMVYYAIEVARDIVTAIPYMAGIQTHAQFVGKLNLFHDTLQLFKRSADFCSFSCHCLQKYSCCLFFFQIFVEHFRNQADSFLASLTDMASRMKIIIISRNVFHTPQVICKCLSGKGPHLLFGCTGI